MFGEFVFHGLALLLLIGLIYVAVNLIGHGYRWMTSTLRILTASDTRLTFSSVEIFLENHLPRSRVEHEKTESRPLLWLGALIFVFRFEISPAAHH